ncbi:Alpha crystallin/Hsp20 domain, partial [Trinorchestia longiramus]
VLMDVKNFDPRNLQVRVVDDNRIVVEGKYQQASSDGGSSSWKTFSKEFTMPEDADIDLVTTALSKEGVLTIRAPRKSQDSAVQAPKVKSSSVQSINESYNAQKNQEGTSTKSTKSTSSSTTSSYLSNGGKALQTSASFESNDSGLDSLPRDLRDRLMVNESGISSVSNSNSSCSSPAPSEAPSDMSRVSASVEFDAGRNSSCNSSQKSDVAFHVEAPANRVQSQQLAEKYKNSGYQSNSSVPKYPVGLKTENYSSSNVSPVFMPSIVRVPKFTPGCGSSGDAVVTIEEKDGKRTVTSEKSNIIQEDGGLMEAKEISAEIDEKNAQSARREAITKIQRSHDDPEGRYKGAEKAEASDVSESCIKRLPDGSTVSVKKSSTSSSSHRAFSSNAMHPSAFDDPFFSMGFGPDFGDLRSLTGRGHSLMSQMSTDSIASTLSGRSRASNYSTASDSSNQSRFSNQSDQSSDQSSGRSSCSDRSRLSNRSSNANDDFMRDPFGFPRGTLFGNRPSLAERFPEFSGALAEFDDFPRMGFTDFPSMNSFSRSSRNSNSSFSSTSSFDSPLGRKFN